MFPVERCELKWRPSILSCSRWTADEIDKLSVIMFPTTFAVFNVRNFFLIMEKLNISTMKVWTGDMRKKTNSSVQTLRVDNFEKLRISAHRQVLKEIEGKLIMHFCSWCNWCWNFYFLVGCGKISNKTKFLGSSLKN